MNIKTSISIKNKKYFLYIHTSIGIEYNYVLILEANLDRCLNFNFKGHLDTKSVESSNSLLSLA